MLNSRKLFKALAVTGLLTLGSVASYAQTCTTVSTSISRALRPEGLTEATSDLIVSGCSSLPDPFNVTVTFPSGFAVANATGLPAGLTVTGPGTPGTPTYGTNSINVVVTGATAGTTGFEVKGIRLNVSGAGAAPLTPVTAQLLITAGLSVILNQSTNVGTVLGPSLNFSVSPLSSTTSLSSLATCVNYPTGGSSVNVTGFINFAEGTNSVFRDATIEQATSPNPPAFKGTYLRAVFANLPAGVTIYLPNSSSEFSLTGSASPLKLKLVSGVNTTPVYDGSAVPASGTTPVIAYTAPSGTVAYASTYGLVTGTEVLYEVTGQDINALETAPIPFLVKFTGGPSVGVGTATVGGGLGPVAAGSLPLFTSNTTSANLFTTTICSTTLLFPYVTTDAGFDTGIAVSNTTADIAPFNTSAQSGTCSINAFGAYGSGATVPAAGTSPSVAAGRTWAFSATDSAVFASGAKLGSGFNGYIIAQCNFQLGHGYAFISTYGLAGANSVAQGYLALVVPNTTRISSSPSGAESLGN